MQQFLYVSWLYTALYQSSLPTHVHTLPLTADSGKSSPTGDRTEELELLAPDERTSRTREANGETNHCF